MPESNNSNVTAPSPRVIIVIRSGLLRTVASAVLRSACTPRAPLLQSILASEDGPIRIFLANRPEQARKMLRSDLGDELKLMNR